MKSNAYITAACALALSFLAACDRGPKTIPVEPAEGGGEGTGVFSKTDGAMQGKPAAASGGMEQDMHTVVALEVLPTAKYVYVRVKEGEEEFWVATLKQEMTVGRSYFYRGGLLKTDFESKEYNRTFDKLYLVSKIVPAEHGNTGDAGAGRSFTPDQGAAAKPAVTAGSVRIADLMADPDKYAGKNIQVSGTCVKLNPNIMGRNWIHLNDGSKGAQDLVVTTGEVVPEGHAVTMVGTVVLNKDFGAGYTYDILVEGATVVK